jgi:hypothetical protein
MGSLGTRIPRDRVAIGDILKIPSPVTSAIVYYPILSVIFIHIIPSHQISVAIANPSLVPSNSCLNTSSYLSNDICAAKNISHNDNLQRTGCLSSFHL